MAPLTEPANPALEPSVIEVLRERRKKAPKQNDVREKIILNHTERTMTSIEYPFLVREVDDALTYFGRNPEWEQLFGDDAHNTSVPFYFDRRPTGRPTMSSNVPTNNVLIKVTVPKRTGRRRKKGSNGPWMDPSSHGKRNLDEDEQDTQDQSSTTPKRPRQDQDISQSVENAEYAADPAFKPPRRGSTHQFSSFVTPPPTQSQDDEDDDDERSPFEKAQQRKRLYSQSHMISPKTLMRMLQDNVGRYKLESVGSITYTHRFRSLADFDMDMSNSKFMNNFIDKVINGNIKSMREFRLETTTTTEEQQFDIIAPPQYTNLALPFQYYYEQNPYVRVNASIQRPELGRSPAVVNPNASNDEDMEEPPDFHLVNVQRNKTFNRSFYIPHNNPGVPELPMGNPIARPESEDPELFAIVLELQHLLHKRPIWTRRSLFNQLGDMDVRSWDLFKRAIQYVAFQFKSGPWHNAVIRFGVDPRTDPKYRKYQTLQFKLQRKGEIPRKRRHRHLPNPVSTKGNERTKFKSKNHWNPQDGDAAANVESRGGGDDPAYDSGDPDLKPSRSTKRYYHDGNPDSHMFDGREYSSSGRVWQVCDITDPLLASLLSPESAPFRPTCSTDGGGWYHSGRWRKVKAIMRLKMLAIRFQKQLKDSDFDATVREYPDRTPSPEPGSGGKRALPDFPLPNLNLTEEELLELQGTARWRRHLRPATGMRYIEKDGTVQTVKDKGPGRFGLSHLKENDEDGDDDEVDPSPISAAAHGDGGSNSHVGTPSSSEARDGGTPRMAILGQTQQVQHHQPVEGAEGGSPSLNQDKVLAQLSHDEGSDSDLDSENDSSNRELGDDFGEEEEEEGEEEDDDNDDMIGPHLGFGDGYVDSEGDMDDEDEDEDQDQEGYPYDEEGGFVYDGELEVTDSDSDADGFEVVPGTGAVHSAASASTAAVPFGLSTTATAGPGGQPPEARQESSEGEEQLMSELFGSSR
ncbi:transcription factor tau subunit sfc1 [Zalerion maritima]|uniref:Transcription factor tau subunit sfc1 n=1 Tax=Zalerion maritima TaxID=339359 RepID=A0AAD5WT18_9PEZI|nr:transcription factor tau subunit sfc1 [Zalerion maritima]